MTLTAALSLIVTPVDGESEGVSEWTDYDVLNIVSGVTNTIILSVPHKITQHRPTLTQV